MDFLSFFLNQTLVKGFVYWVETLWFLLLPFALFCIFWPTWLYKIRGQFLKKTQWVLLELKLPREIYKSPRAMEVVLSIFHSTRDGNLIEKYRDGLLRSWSSLEIVSIGGQVHFFVYIQKAVKNMVESQFYAQYPEVEIVEVEDYTRAADFEDFEKWKAWGVEFGLAKDDAYPIKTYIDYDLQELATKEEQKTDPITAFLEYLGSLKKDEQVWFQILIMASKKKWAGEGQKLIDKIIGLPAGSDPEERMKKMWGLSSGQENAIKAIERCVSKIGFDTGIRAVYLAPRDVFSGVNKLAIYGLMKNYGSLDLNGFKALKTGTVDYFFKKRREARLAREMLEYYQKRAYFYQPYYAQSFVLNTEELATIFHLPGRVAETPTFGRIETKKSEPPTNLPI